MRSAAQIRATPAEYQDAQTVERQRILAELLRELRRAAVAREPWYEWLRARVERRHLHELRDDNGRPVACPVPGCVAVAGERSTRKRGAPTADTGAEAGQLALS